jgi:hypothetical protein
MTQIFSLTPEQQKVSKNSYWIKSVLENRGNFIDNALGSIEKLKELF